MPANLISPCSGLSDTHSKVPYGTRKRNPLAATAADSMSRAMASDCDRRRMVAAWSPSSQFRLSTLATVPVLITRLSSNPLSPVTSPTACSSATCILGHRRNRHPQRQFLILHVILADVSVSEGVIAELLRVPQPGTVAEHQPGMGTKHCDVVGDVARIRRAGANVDHGDAAGSLLNQMKSRHLRRALGRRVCGT